MRSHPERPPELLLLDPAEVRPTKDYRLTAESPEEWAGFVASIRAHGVLEPVLVGRDRRGFFLHSGHRRWRGAKEAKVKLPAIPIGDRTTGPVAAIIENYQRRPLRPAELATALEEAAAKYPDVRDLASTVGLSPEYVHQLLRIKRKACPDLWDLFSAHGEGVQTKVLADIIRDHPKAEDQIKAWNALMSRPKAERPPSSGKPRARDIRRTLLELTDRMENEPGNVWLEGATWALRWALGEGKGLE